ncbi:MAG TPA: MBL fold metallo-hydrolase [Archangium sp.]|nr:MBL fold metallo-hydrolase [Archangium sp.]
MIVSSHQKLALLASLALVAWAGRVEAAKDFTIQSYTASENAFLVSAHIIESNGEIALVDAQMFNDEADKFIEKAKKAKGTVKTLFITHAHPDHFFGLQRLKAAFPEARLVAMPATVEAVGQAGPGMLKFYREGFMNGALAANLPTELPALEKLEGNTLKVGNAEFEVLHFPAAEVKDAYALWHKGTGTLLSGDLVYNNAHLWLADQEPQGWIAALEQLQKLPVKKIYAGHGEPGGKDLLKKNLEYLTFFEKTRQSAKSGEELNKAVKGKFKKLRVQAVLDFSANKYFPPQQQGGGSATPEEEGKGEPGGKGPGGKPEGNGKK